jgi:cytochrome c oxidase cbb3-type subunit 4
MIGLEHNLMLGFAKSWGLFYLIALALGVVVYTFWPGNKKRFEQAARLPLEKDPESDEKDG